MAYVYRHIRKDTGETFYIGIGNQDKYKRAFSLIKRNRFWKNITSKTEFEIEILHDGLSWEDACKKEKELILLYGRRDLNRGPLVNMTDGGDGTFGVIHSEEWYEKQRSGNSKKGKPISLAHRQNISLNHKSKNSDCTKSGNRPIDVFDKNWVFINSFSSIIEASISLGIRRGVIDNFLTGRTKRPYKYRFKYKIVD